MVGAVDLLSGEFVLLEKRPLRSRSVGLIDRRQGMHEPDRQSGVQPNTQRRDRLVDGRRVDGVVSPLSL